MHGTLQRLLRVRSRGQPSDLAAVKAWWHADDVAIGAVAAWRDRVGGVTPVQASGTLQPVKAASSFNGLPGVTGDGTDDELTTTSLGNIPTGSTEGYIFALIGGAAAGAVTCCGGYGAQGTAIQRRLSTGSTGTPQVVDGTTTENGTAASCASGYHLLVGNWVGTTENGWLDGVAFAANPTTIASLNTSTTRLRLFANAQTAAAQFWTKPIRSFVITTALTVAERQFLEGVMMWDGEIQTQLASTHPYVNVRP